MSYMNEYRRWIEKADNTTRDELLGIAENEKEIEERFYQTLEFGTAGLRGIMGAGSNRMNKYVVRQAAYGLAMYLKGIEGACDRGVVIYYDSRLRSDEFAKETALVMVKMGIKTYLSDRLRSVPQLSFAVRTLNCAAGVVITASHNPSEYNGFKVYDENGCQMPPKACEEITRLINSTDIFDVEFADDDSAVIYVGDKLDEQYYDCISELRLHKELTDEQKKTVNIVYTPLHGSGAIPVAEILKRTGFENVTVVEEQREPDGRFPTVKAPNPEDPAAFKLAKQYAKRTNADLLIATDPDADRLGVCVRAGDDYIQLNGNQIGVLLLSEILRVNKERGTLHDDAFAVRSLVSTPMADAVASEYGVAVKEVLTGFRFIGEAIAESKKSGNGHFVFGFEESYGFLEGTYARDKDAICSALIIAEQCAYYASKGITLYDVLESLYKKHGYYAERTISYTAPGKDGMEKIAGIMQSARESKKSEIDGVGRIIKVVDYKNDDTGLPKSNVLRYTFDNGTWVILRPSGTEPKLKLYIGVKSDSEVKANEMLDHIAKVLDREWCSEL